MAGLLESILWQDSPARSLGNKDLEVKSLFFFHLRDVPSRVRALGWALLLAPGVGPRFRPDQKVKLDKSEARRGAAHPPAVMKEPALRSRRRGGPLLKKSEKWGTPLLLLCSRLAKRAMLAREVGHPPVVVFARSGPPALNNGEKD